MWVVAIFVVIIGVFLILSWARLEQMNKQNIVSVPSRDPDEVPTGPISQFWLWYWIIFGLFLLFRVIYSLSGSTAHLLNQVTPVVLLMMLVAFLRAVYVWLKPVMEETPGVDQLVDSEEYTSCNRRTADVFYSSLGSQELLRFEVLIRAIKEKGLAEPELGLRLRQYFLKSVSECESGYSILGITHRDKSLLYEMFESCVIERSSILDSTVSPPVQKPN